MRSVPHCIGLLVVTCHVVDPQTEWCLIISRLSSALVIHVMRKEALLTRESQFLSEQLLNISLSTAIEGKKKHIIFCVEGDAMRYFFFVSSGNHSSSVPSHPKKCDDSGHSNSGSLDSNSNSNPNDDNNSNSNSNKYGNCN